MPYSTTNDGANHDPTQSQCHPQSGQVSGRGADNHPPNTARIDIGSASHFVAVSLGRGDQPVREFAGFTVDLHANADWLAACGMDTVAMESTGVY